jgi:Transcriptional regulator, AbiEi antitoxin
MEQALRRLAERQHGVVSRTQASRLGIDRRGLRRRVAAGTWVLVTPRVFRLTGVRPTFEQRCMAAVLDSGEGSLIARASAATLWQLPGVRAERIDVLRLRGAPGSATQLARTHQTKLLPAHHHDVRVRIPVTSVARTLFDLTTVWSGPRLERALDAALANKIVTAAELHQMLHELTTQGRDGLTIMRHLLEWRGPGYVPPASGIEARFFAILDAAGVPVPTLQVDVGGERWIGRVDFAYLDVGLLIEIDSDLYHTTRLDRLADLDRDLALRAAGFRRVLRIGEAMIWDQPDRVVAVVLAARAEAAAA